MCCGLIIKTSVRFLKTKKRPGLNQGAKRWRQKFALSWRCRCKLKKKFSSRLPKCALKDKALVSKTTFEQATLKTSWHRSGTLGQTAKYTTQRLSFFRVREAPRQARAERNFSQGEVGKARRDGAWCPIGCAQAGTARGPAAGLVCAPGLQGGPNTCAHGR